MKFILLNIALNVSVIFISCMLSFANASLIGAFTSVGNQNGEYYTTVDKHPTTGTITNDFFSIDYSTYQRTDERIYGVSDNDDFNWKFDNEIHNILSYSCQLNPIEHCISGTKKNISGEYAKSFVDKSTGESKLEAYHFDGNSPYNHPVNYVTARTGISDRIYFDQLEQDIELTLTLNLEASMGQHSTLQRLLSLSAGHVDEYGDYTAMGFTSLRDMYGWSWRGIGCSNSTFWNCHDVTNLDSEVKRMSELYDMFEMTNFTNNFLEYKDIEELTEVKFTLKAGSSHLDLDVNHSIFVQNNTFIDVGNTSWFNMSFSEPINFRTGSGTLLSNPRPNLSQVVSVPEPSTLTIFALGMIGLASRRFKKQS